MIVGPHQTSISNLYALHPHQITPSIHRLIRTYKTNLNSAERLQFSNAHSLRKRNREIDVRLPSHFRIFHCKRIRCWHDFCTIYLIRRAMQSITRSPNAINVWLKMPSKLFSNYFECQTIKFILSISPHPYTMHIFQCARQ